MKTEALLGVTMSVCPECLRRVAAQKVRDRDGVYLVKECPEHGRFQTLIWRGEPHYERWSNSKVPAAPTALLTGTHQGCPYDCGLCPEHRQQTCCVLFEVTARCNLHCPVCFANTQAEPGIDPDIKRIETWYRRLLECGGPFNIQLSGGEPTLRDDLPEIIHLGRELGFRFFQLNTNGLRLAQEPEYLARLKAAGLNCVFLQFDGTTDSVYRTLRGKDLLQTKTAALEQCARLQMGVVLVPTIVPGVNMDEVGNIIRFAVARMPAVRGVHFQPISYLGRYPAAPDAERITLPDLIRAIEDQTAGRIKVQNFVPPGAENAHCSFHGNFILMPDGELKALTVPQAQGCCGTPPTATEASQKSQQFVARQWSQPGSCCQETAKADAPAADGTNTESLDRFLERVEAYRFAISAMAFQDAWNLDLERLKDCFIQVMSGDGKLIPFCAYNLTARDGRTLYRKGGPAHE